MKKFSRTVVVLASCASMLCVAAPATALIDISVGQDNATWPSEASLLQACVNPRGCETYDPTNIPKSGGHSTNNNATDGFRVAWQSFRVTDPGYIDSFYVGIHSTKAGTYNVRLHSTSDTTISADTDPLFTATVAEGLALPSVTSGERIIRFDLSSPVQLNPLGGDAGYAIAFSQDDPNEFGIFAASVQNHWQYDSFAMVQGEPGHYAYNSGDLNGNKATPIALVGQLGVTPVIPEPASLTLLGLGSLLMLRRRRNA